MHDDGAEDEGLSTKKVVAGAALGVALPAAVGVAKKLLTHDEDGGQDGGEEPAGPAEREQEAKPSGSSKAKPKAPARSRTRKQLYQQATRLKIEGRSQMNKAQLERAIQRAKS